MLSSDSCASVKIRHCRRKRQKTKRVEGGGEGDREEDRNADGRKPQGREEEKEDKDRRAEKEA